MQDEKGEDRIVAKLKPTLNLVTDAATSSSIVQRPIASKIPGILRAPCQTDWKITGRPGAREQSQDAASSSQVWQKDAMLDESTRRLVAADKEQELLDFHENLKSTRKIVASGISDSEDTDKIWPHNLDTSTTEMWSQPGRQNGKSRCECGKMEHIYLPSLFKLQFILEKIIPKIYVSGISPYDH